MAKKKIEKHLIFLLLVMGLSACGDTDEKRTYIINGQNLHCTVIDQEPCGLTLACEGEGIFQCYTN